MAVVDEQDRDDEGRTSGDLGDAQVVTDLRRTDELEQAVAELRREVRESERQAVLWRAKLIESEAELARERREAAEEAADLWARLRANERQVKNLDELVEAMEHTISWRVTQPLRLARRLSGERRQGSGVPDAIERPPEDLMSPVELPRRAAPTKPEVDGFVRRLRAACEFLEHRCEPGSTVVDAIECFAVALDGADLPDGVAAWLALAVAAGSYPDRAALEVARRVLRRDGHRGLCQHARQHFVAAVGEQDELPDLEFVTDAVLVDITHTAMYDLHTGIQRVTRECASRWLQRDDVLLVHFDEDARSLKQLSDAERQRALHWRDNMHDIGGEIRRRRPSERTGATLVPWHCVHVIPELVDSVIRTDRYSALQQSGMLVGQSLIGYDLIPITAAEYTARGVPEAFAHYLLLIKHASAVSVISNATAGELRSFCGALPAQGLKGPRITARPLPAGTVEVDGATMEAARNHFHLGSLPLVVVVGSHEPRKNHLMVLEAAERLWTSGHRFELLFAGGASWGRADFKDEVRRLVAHGYPLQVHRRIGEQSLWALYHLATFTVFISYLEGYGLPVAESLSCGTPVITTNYGSMAEIAAGGGALTVDPRDIDDVERAMIALLEDGTRRDDLARDAATRTWPTWSDYAETLWRDLVESVRLDGVHS